MRMLSLIFARVKGLQPQLLEYLLKAYIVRPSGRVLSKMSNCAENLVQLCGQTAAIVRSILSECQIVRPIVRSILNCAANSAPNFVKMLNCAANCVIYIELCGQSCAHFSQKC